MYYISISDGVLKNGFSSINHTLCHFASSLQKKTYYQSSSLIVMSVESTNSIPILEEAVLYLTWKIGQF